MSRIDHNSRRLAATCSRGLEPVLATEVRRLGIASGEVEEGRGAVYFDGGLAAIYRANLELRTAMRIMVPLAKGEIRSRRELYEFASNVAWGQLLRPRQTIAVEAVGRIAGLANTAFAAQVVKDAVVDRLRDRRGWRPDVDRKDPDVRIHLHLATNASTLSLDSSGEPLSHRGYRPRGGPAPLSETLAAGILLFTGYDGSAPLLDPMCGTGTFAIEAAMLATATAPGLRRHFAYQRWAWHDRKLELQQRERAQDQVHPAAAPILACDADRRAAQATVRNLRAADVRRWVEVKCQGLDALELPGEGTVIVCNPPYGRRVGAVEELRSLYRELGDAFKQRAAGATAWVIAGERELAKEIGLKASRRIPLFNGPIECRLLRFDLWPGRASDQSRGGRNQS